MGTPTQPIHQHTNTPTHQHTNTPTHQHANTPTHQHTNTPTHQHTNTPTHQPHQHTNTLKIHTFRKSVTYPQQPTTNNNVDTRDPTGSKNCWIPRYNEVQNCWL